MPSACLYRIVALLVLLTCSAPLIAQDLDGVWTGIASTESEETRLQLHIQNTQDGFTASMSLPDIGVTGWPATSVHRDGPSIRITFPSDSGPQTMRLQIDTDSAEGSWQESRFEEPASLQLSRLDQSQVFTEERLFVRGPAGNIGVSMFIPECPEKCPGVVFLHGSGPQPRDSNRFAALKLAEYGIASAIFDKRGVGVSEGMLEGATFNDLAADARSVATELLSRSKVSSIGFFGHSQGGWIAPLAALGTDADFVITSAGPAVPPAREAEWDVVRRLRLAGYSHSAEQAARHIIAGWHQGIRSNDWTTFDTAVDSAHNAKWFKEAGFGNFMQRPSPDFSRSYQAFMDFDPIPVLERLDIPLLAILAPEDESIDAMETADILVALAGEGLDLLLRMYPGYDHSMRRLGSDDRPVRWPELPNDYYAIQADFILRGTR